MSVSGTAALQVKSMPDGRGMRFYGLSTATGDASGGTAQMALTFVPWVETYVIVERWALAEDNALTDSGSISAQTGAFGDPHSWGSTYFEVGLINQTSPLGTFYLTRNVFTPVYLGRYTNGATTPNQMFLGVVNPNTNGKHYYMIVAGKLLFYEPNRI